MTRTFCIIFLFFAAHFTFAQRKVAITIDDVPNTINYQANNYASPLLECIDSLQIPVAIFINESQLYKTDSTVRNFSLLDNWIKREYITLGNHTFSHLRYSKTSLDTFKEDVLKGEAITRSLALKHQKKLSYFRFPFNDLGQDSSQHEAMHQYLSNYQYTIVPFTIESADWVYNSLYEHYLKLGKKKDAERVAKAYVDHTLALFAYFEKTSEEVYYRPINHIYLCHDNSLNAKYLPLLIAKLKDRNYAFISLEEALQDDVYRSTDFYKGKWGFSWLYRWIEDPKKRQAMMKKEPSMMVIFKEYEGITQLK